MTSISAKLTTVARRLNARALGGLSVGDWSFQIGNYGYDTLDPTEALIVDPTDTALTTPIGGSRLLGRVLLSGAGASATTLTQGLVQVNGLAGMPTGVARRWLAITGSSDAGLNGTWFIREWLSATSVVIDAPLATTAAGALGWEFREACVLRPNARAASFQCVIPLSDASDGTQLGEVGVFGRVIRDPQNTGLLGTSFLFALAHHPSIVKDPLAKVIHHVVTQS